MLFRSWRARRQSGKKSAAAEEARHHCFRVHEERGPRTPSTRAPEMGVSRSYHLGPQRGAGTATTANFATKNPVCKHRSLSTPPFLGACAAYNCQDPVIQGQLPQKNTQCTSGWCNITPASAATGSPSIPIITTISLPLPGLSEQGSPNQPLL